MILAIPILAILNSILSYFSRKLYHQIYACHIAFEPITLTEIPLNKTIAQTIISLIAFLMGPLFLWSQGYSESTAFYALCGYTIGHLAYVATRHIFSIIVFLYIQKNPSLVSGKATFKFQAVRMINVAAVIQELIFLTIIVFFAPSPLIIGVLGGILVTGIGYYFSKTPQPIV